MNGNVALLKHLPFYHDTNTIPFTMTTPNGSVARIRCYIQSFRCDRNPDDISMQVVGYAYCQLLSVRSFIIILFQTQTQAQNYFLTLYIHSCVTIIQHNTVPFVIVFVIFLLVKETPIEVK